MLSRVRSALSLLVLLPGLCGCGAGLIVGIAAGSSNNGSPPPVQPPAIPATGLTLPLFQDVKGPFPFATLAVNNYRAPAGAEVVIRLEALGTSDDLPVFGFVVDANSNTTTITFRDVHPHILAAVGDPTLRDVAAVVSVRVDGELIGSQSLPLIQRRVASLEPEVPGETIAVVSVLGGSTVRLRVTGRDDETELPDDLQFAVAGTPPVQSNPPQQRIPGSKDFLVTGTAPPNRFPIRRSAFVVDSLTGVSTQVAAIAYRPAVLAVSPAVGSTEGNDKVVLFGEGLAPQSNVEDPMSPPDFSKVSIEFTKGGRTLTVQPSQIRTAESKYTQLVFQVPQSPDGTPGAAQITLKVDLGSVEVSAPAVEYTYRRPSPGFGPRGALLTDMPIRVRFVDVDGEPGDAPDATLLSSLGGIPRVELLVAQQNGMFASFGPTFAAGEQADPGQRLPTDLCAGDFDDDGDADLLVINQGTNNVATHTWLAGEAKPKAGATKSPPFGPPVPLPAQPGAAFSVSGDLDGDGVTDVVLLPLAGSPVEPQIALARARSPSLFTFAPFGSPLSMYKPFDAAALADADGDGALDLLCLTAGVVMRLVIAYGDGHGSFASPLTVIPLVLPGYTPDTASRAIGVHVVDGGTGPRPIALVLTGLDASAATPPTIATLTPMPGAPRQYGMPAATEVLTYPTNRAFVASAFGDLDGAASGELVVGATSDTPPNPPELRLLQFAAGTWTEIAGGFSPSLESMGVIRGVSIATAVPAESGRAPIRAVIVHHRLKDSTEERLSTWLAAPAPTLHLIAPDASLELANGVQGAALGDFSGQAVTSPTIGAKDLCLATALGIDLYTNDGVGGFTLGNSHALPGVVPGSLATIASNSSVGNGVAFLRVDGVLGTLYPADSSAVLSGVDLRTYATAAAQGWDISLWSRLCSADIDGDGVQDLVVMLVLENPANASAYETDLLLLRGKVAPSPGALPFHLPSGAAPVFQAGERTTSVAAGQFVDPGDAGGPLEVALAFPDQSNSVRFFRYQRGATPPEDRLVWSFAQQQMSVLIAGDQPAQLAAADFDHDKTTDLVVASAGDSGVRVYSNSGDVDMATPDEVNIGAFSEGLTVPALPPGFPTAMLSADLDGDGNDDLVVVTSDTSTGQKNQSFAAYGTGNGGLRSLGLLSQARTGNKRPNNTLRDGDVFPALADVNRDGVPDLVIGWSTAQMNDHNLRIMFGAAR